MTGGRTYLDTAERIANASITRLARPAGVLYEVGCEPENNCDSDPQRFKGIFVRYLWCLDRRDPQPQYLGSIPSNLNAMWSGDRTAANTFGIHWNGPVTAQSMNTEVEAVEAFTATSVPHEAAHGMGARPRRVAAAAAGASMARRGLWPGPHALAARQPGPREPGRHPISCQRRRRTS